MLICLLVRFHFGDHLLDYPKSFHHVGRELIDCFIRQLHTVDGDLIVPCFLPLLVIFLLRVGDFLLCRLLHCELVWEGWSRRDLLHRLIAQKCRLHGVFLLLNRGRLAQRGVHFALGLGGINTQELILFLLRNSCLFFRLRYLSQVFHMPSNGSAFVYLLRANTEHRFQLLKGLGGLSTQGPIQFFLCYFRLFFRLFQLSQAFYIISKGFTGFSRISAQGTAPTLLNLICIAQHLLQLLKGLGGLLAPYRIQSLFFLVCIFSGFANLLQVFLVIVKGSACKLLFRTLIIGRPLICLSEHSLQFLEGLGGLLTPDRIQILLGRVCPHFGFIQLFEVFLAFSKGFKFSFLLRC